MQLAGSSNQGAFRLRALWIRDAAVDRTDNRASFLIEEADALGALFRNNIEDVVGQRRMHDAVELVFDAALIDGGIGTLRLTGAAVDTFTGDDRCHERKTSNPWI